jgi:predicted alpha/beta-fold hydrolase
MGSDFRPFPLLGNPHLQTIVGSLWQGRDPHFRSEEKAVTLLDGDQLLLHDSVPETWQPGDRIVLLVHGLGGSHASGYMKRMAGRLLPHGLRVIRLDLRGCGRGMALARRPYHGGCSHDVRAAALAIHQWSPASPLILIGFSLGGNIVLKLAGEARADPLPNLERVAAISAPIDMTRCAALLAQPRNRLYELHYVRDLVRQVRQRQQIRPDEPRIVFPRPMTMRRFDDLYTAPRWGFDDALDYYRSASSVGLIPRIAVPAFILTARDDPFVAVEPFEKLAGPRHIEVTILARGGHLGFLGWNGGHAVRWAERRLAEWVLESRQPFSHE